MLRVKRAVPFVIVVRPLADAGSGGTHRAGLAPVRRVRRGHRVGAGGRVSAAHVDDARRRGGSAHRHDLAGAGVRRLRQRERAAGRDRVPRRAGGRQVRTGTSDQPVHGEPFRPLVARARLQHRADRRGDRAGVSEQHGARRRPLSGRAVRGARRGLAARRSGGSTAGRLSDVLRDGEPRRLLRAVDDRHVGQSDRPADRAGFRARHRLRQVAASRRRCRR